MATTYSPACRLSDRQLVWAVYRSSQPVLAADGRPLVMLAYRLAALGREFKG